jgi:hypothetical protein
MLVPGSYRAATNLIFKRAGRTIGDELRMCQRYYERTSGSSVILTIQQRNDNGGSRTTSFVPFAVEKRATPNMPQTSWSELVGGYPIRTGIYSVTTRGFSIDFGIVAIANPVNGDWIADIEL